MHEERPEIGWEKFHEGTIKFIEAKYKGELKMKILEIYPISSNNTWIQDVMISKIGNHTFRDLFSDSLVKTVDDWRVTLSVVIPERKTKEETK